jgi:hypothetical protein
MVSADSNDGTYRPCINQMMLYASKEQKVRMHPHSVTTSKAAAVVCSIVISLLTMSKAQASWRCFCSPPLTWTNHLEGDDGWQH